MEVFRKGRTSVLNEVDQKRFVRRVDSQEQRHTYVHLGDGFAQLTAERAELSGAIDEFQRATSRRTEFGAF